jgi:ribosomal protein S18 acetylase RimI-like enzyme
MARKPKQRILHMRWMIESDLDAVLEIEKQGFVDPWDENTFRQCLRIRSCIGMVMVYGNDVVGYMVYERHKRHIDVLNIAVRNEYRRMCVGSAMLDKLKTKMSVERISSLSLMVIDENLEAHLWLRSNGFRCTEVVRGLYADHPHQDVYKFMFEVKE